MMNQKVGVLRGGWGIAHEPADIHMDGIMRILLHPATLGERAADRSAGNRCAAESTRSDAAKIFCRTESFLQVDRLEAYFVAVALGFEKRAGGFLEGGGDFALARVEIIPIGKAKARIVDGRLQLMLELENVSAGPGYEPPLRVP